MSLCHETHIFLRNQRLVDCAEYALTFNGTLERRPEASFYNGCQRMLIAVTLYPSVSVTDPCIAL